MRRILALLIISFFSHCLYAADNDKMFEKIFADWTNAFNHQDLDGSCRLFANNVVADYQGVPQKNYAAICDGFKKIFSEKNMRYQYRFKIHHVYREDDLAAVRITWYLKIFKDQALVSSQQDEGLDIFKRNKKNEWKIVNYVGFPVK